MPVRGTQDVHPIPGPDPERLGEPVRDRHLPRTGTRFRAEGEMVVLSVAEQHRDGDLGGPETDRRLSLRDDRVDRKHGGGSTDLSVGSHPVEGRVPVDIDPHVLDRGAGGRDRRRQDEVAGRVRVDGAGRHHAHAEGERQHHAKCEQALSDQASEQEAEHRHR